VRPFTATVTIVVGKSGTIPTVPWIPNHPIGVAHLKETNAFGPRQHSRDYRRIDLGGLPTNDSNRLFAFVDDRRAGISRDGVDGTWPVTGRPLHLTVGSIVTEVSPLPEGLFT
jgi:hypothetical protein